MYLTTWESGLFRRCHGESSWRNISPKDFRARTVQSAYKGYRKISAFAANPDSPGTIAAATKHDLYLSSDAGLTWKAFPLSGDFKKNQITSLALRGKLGEMLAGTSYAGIFRGTGRGLAADSSGLPSEAYSDTLRFFDEIGATAFGASKRAFLGMSVSGEIFSQEKKGGPWRKIAFIPGRPAVDDIAESMDTLYVSAGGKIYVVEKGASPRPHARLNGIVSSSAIRGATGIFIAGSMEGAPPLFVSTANPFDAAPASSRASIASGKKALYANAAKAGRSIDALITTMEKCGFNAIVIDMKDDFGGLYFPSKNATAKAIGACRRPLDIAALMAKLHGKKFYVIARMVVFKDKYLYRAFNGNFAVGNRATGGPWMGSPGEYWVDPHSEFVQNYNIELATEAASLGFDEIQFDYIRFPSDGPIGLCNYRHRKDAGAYKSEVIADFLRAARSRVPVPISVDVYGITGWYRFGNRIGQDFEAIAANADAICPMVYPSHFGSRFYRNRAAREYLPGLLVRESCERARFLAGSGAVIRPYLQAFNLLSPTWGPGYITGQANAAFEGKADGYTFWNAGGDYSMVLRALGR